MRILVEAVLNIPLHWGQFSLCEEKQYLPLPGSVCPLLTLQGTPVLLSGAGSHRPLSAADPVSDAGSSGGQSTHRAAASEVAVPLTGDWAETALWGAEWASPGCRGAKTKLGGFQGSSSPTRFYGKHFVGCCLS